MSSEVIWASIEKDNQKVWISHLQVQNYKNPVKLIISQFVSNFIRNSNMVLFQLNDRLYAINK